MTPTFWVSTGEEEAESFQHSRHGQTTPLGAVCVCVWGGLLWVVQPGFEISHPKPFQTISVIAAVPSIGGRGVVTPAWWWSLVVQSRSGAQPGYILTPALLVWQKLPHATLRVRGPPFWFYPCSFQGSRRHRARSPVCVGEGRGVQPLLVTRSGTSLRRCVSGPSPALPSLSLTLCGSPRVETRRQGSG